MHLAPPHQQQILSIIRSAYGTNCRVWLFGSRVHDYTRGGDLDLYVETELLRPQSGAVCKRHQVALAIEEVIDGISVDLLVRYRDDREQALQTLAKQKGISLDD